MIGDRLGLYRTLAEAGPLNPAELAERTGTTERYVREWLGAQAASGYVEYDPGSGRYALTAEQAAAFADESSPAFVGGGFQVALGAAADIERIQEAFLTGQGMGWHEHGNDVFEGCRRFFEPGYRANLLDSWIPALDGVAPPPAVRVAERARTGAGSRCCCWASRSTSPSWPASRGRSPVFVAAVGFDQLAGLDELGELGCDPLARQSSRLCKLASGHRVPVGESFQNGVGAARSAAALRRPTSSRASVSRRSIWWRSCSIVSAGQPSYLAGAAHKSTADGIPRWLGTSLNVVPRLALSINDRALRSYALVGSPVAVSNSKIL